MNITPPPNSSTVLSGLVKVVSHASTHFPDALSLRDIRVLKSSMPSAYGDQLNNIQSMRAAQEVQKIRRSSVETRERAKEHTLGTIKEQVINFFNHYHSNDQVMQAVTEKLTQDLTSHISDADTIKYVKLISDIRYGCTSNQSSDRIFRDHTLALNLLDNGNLSETTIRLKGTDSLLQNRLFDEIRTLEKILLPANITREREGQREQALNDFGIPKWILNGHDPSQYETLFGPNAGF